MRLATRITQTVSRIQRLTQKPQKSAEGRRNNNITPAGIFEPHKMDLLVLAVCLSFCCSFCVVLRNLRVLRQPLELWMSASLTHPTCGTA